jgi:hypothetical protein
MRALALLSLVALFYVLRLHLSLRPPVPPPPAGATAPVRAP